MAGIVLTIILRPKHNILGFSWRESAMAPCDPDSFLLSSVAFPPQFPGHTHHTYVRSELIRSFNDSLRDFIINRFPDTAYKLDADDKGEYCVFVRINSRGRLCRLIVDGKNAEIKKKIKRVFRTLPTLRPAVTDLNTVSVYFFIPVTFKEHKSKSMNDICRQFISKFLSQGQEEGPVVSE